MFFTCASTLRIQNLDVPVGSATGGGVAVGRRAVRYKDRVACWRHVHWKLIVEASIFLP